MLFRTRNLIKNYVESLINITNEIYNKTNFNGITGINFKIVNLKVVILK